MISIYEAVAPVVQQQKRPAPGAVVPQIQQQTQPAQVPAQQANMANQPAANAGQQQNTTTPSQKNVNSATSQQENQPQQQVNQQLQQDQSTSPDWKKYLKYASLVGGAIGGGALLHDIYHNGGLSNWAHNRFGDISSKFSNGGNFLGMLGFDGSETDTVDQSDENDVRQPSTSLHRNVKYDRAINHLTTSAPMVGPRSTPTVDPWTYNHHRPQPGGLVKTMMPGVRQGYTGRGGNTGLFGFFGSGSGGGSLTFSGRGRSFPNDNDSSRGVYIGSSHGILDPINNYDLGLRHGDMNGA